jgi:hypothetical protein
MPPPQDDVALRSQEYALQADQSVEPSRQRQFQAGQGFVQSAEAGAGIYQQRMQDRRRQMLAEREMSQRQQELDMQKSTTASNLALQQTRIKQAEQELMFTQQIHNTKAIQAQREIVESQARMSKLQADKLEREMAGEIPISQVNPETIWGARASGLAVEPGPNGLPQVSKTPLSKEDTAAAYPVWRQIKLDQGAAGIERARVTGELANQRQDTINLVNQKISEAKLSNSVTMADKKEIAAMMLAQFNAGAEQKRVETQNEGAQKRVETQTEAQKQIAAGQLDLGKATLEEQKHKNALDAEIKNQIAEMGGRKEKIRATIKLLEDQAKELQADLRPEAAKELADVRYRQQKLTDELNGTPAAAGNDAKMLDEALQRLQQGIEAARPKK